MTRESSTLPGNSPSSLCGERPSTRAHPRVSLSGTSDGFRIADAVGTARTGAARSLFSQQGGSPLPMLGGKQVPNVALLFRGPLAFETLRRRGGLSVFFTEYGPAGADRPLLGALGSGRSVRPCSRICDHLVVMTVTRYSCLRMTPGTAMYVSLGIFLRRR
jgi:hypothetical protein